MNALHGHHAHTVWRERAVEVDVSPLAAGSYLEIVVHDPRHRAPDQLLEYIVDVEQPDEALRLGVAYARDFIDGVLH